MQLAPFCTGQSHTADGTIVAAGEPGGWGDGWVGVWVWGVSVDWEFGVFKMGVYVWVWGGDVGGWGYWGGGVNQPAGQNGLGDGSRTQSAGSRTFKAARTPKPQPITTYTPQPHTQGVTRMWAATSRMD